MFQLQIKNKGGFWLIIGEVSTIEEAKRLALIVDFEDVPMRIVPAP